jgi:hypothetical protein
MVLKFIEFETLLDQLWRVKVSLTGKMSEDIQDGETELFLRVTGGSQSDQV